MNSIWTQNHEHNPYIMRALQRPSQAVPEGRLASAWVFCVHFKAARSKTRRRSHTEQQERHVARSITGPSPDCTQSDEYFMGLALQQAQQGFAAAEVPIGAVLVSGSELISMSYNETEQRQNPLCHAELLCIMEAAEKLQAWRLQDATLYTTVEPCPMCAGAILQARLKRLVYGAKQPRIGADGSWVAMFPSQQQQQQQQRQEPQLREQQHTEFDHQQQPQQGQSTAMDCSQAANSSPVQQDSYQQQTDCIVPKGNHPFHTRIEVTSGVREEECRTIMQLFFRKRRQQQKDAKPAVTA